MGLHAQQDVLEVCEGVDTVALGGLHERVEDGEVARGLLVSEVFINKATRGAKRGGYGE